MTAEEIIYKNGNEEVTTDLIVKMMQEYAEEEAKEFGNWSADNGYQKTRHDNNKNEPEFYWYKWKGDFIISDPYTIEELYQIYRSQKQ